MKRLLLFLAVLSAFGAQAASKKPLVWSASNQPQQLQSADALWNGTNPFGLMSGSFTSGHCLQSGGGALIVDVGAACGAVPGSGTVTNVSSANGDLTVATPTTTPVLTIVSAPKLDTPRSIAISGDGIWTVTFDGSAGVTAALTLATVNSGPGACGDATHVCQVTTNGKGLVTAQSAVAITATGVTTTGSPATGDAAIFTGTTSISNANLSGVPQGRLTLTSGAPVMSADVSAGTTIYYDCYAGIAVLYYNGTVDHADNITSCELSTALKASSTGVQNSGDLFDVFYDHVSATICVATNGSGGGWASDTGGSTTARGTGYSQLHNVRGYWTNVNSIAHCYNGATDEGSLAADKATYLGTFYTTAAGTTKMAFRTAGAAGGNNPCMCLWNAYNRVDQTSIAIDSTASWTYGSTSWRSSDNSASNRVSWVDGLGQSIVRTVFTDALGEGTVAAAIAVDEDSTTATPVTIGQNNFNSGALVGQITTPYEFPPKIGLHYGQAVEQGAAGTPTFLGAPFHHLHVSMPN